MPNSTIVNEVTCEIEQVGGFAFRTHFDKGQYGDLLMDEPPPIGEDSAPNPVRVLAAAVGNCMCASLLFCARKAGSKVDSIKAKVKTSLVRNEAGRLRIGKIDVELDPNFGIDEVALAARCTEAFQQFCIVTESVRDGIDVGVTVKSSAITDLALALT
jgi:uncharacterized OsmC-like protein